MSSIRIDGIKHERWDTTPPEQQLGVLGALDVKLERLAGDRDHLIADLAMRGVIELPDVEQPPAA